MGILRIGQLAQTSGSTTKTIRYYEAAGLLTAPGRTDAGYRVYQDSDIERLLFIRKAQQVGLSLAEIKSILALHDRREPTCVHVRSLLDAKLAQVDTALKDLQALRNDLLRLRNEAGSVEDCRPEGGVICSFIERLNTRATLMTPALPRGKASRSQRR